MADLEVPRQSGKVKARLWQPAGQDVYLQMSLLLYILNASFVKPHRCHSNLVMFLHFDYFKRLSYLNKMSYKPSEI